MTHGDAVVNGDRVELLGHAASRSDFAGHELAEILEMHMSGHELGERVGDGDDRLVEIVVGHSRGSPERPGSGHVASMGGGAGAIRGHD
ncbi:unannotated protein [freshwater metagenome]|uniref:Unannotated protein n=1 Tax=freshwater metagenome TaxID=449393 RepID=A0A6J5YFE6_9ZZZZ